MRAEWGAMDAEWRLVLAFIVDKRQVEPLRYGEVHLVRRQGELAAYRAPDLHVDLGTVESRLVRYLHVWHVAVNHRLAHHLLRLEPEPLVVDVLLAQALLMVRREAHHVLFDAE